MTIPTVVIVVAGVATTAALGLVAGFDAGVTLIFGLVVALGVLSVAVARKAGSGAITPARCPSCGGVVSANAPFCKHCGRRA